MIAGKNDAAARPKANATTCATDVEITRSNPAAVDSAAARPPAATKPTTQFGSRAFSGLANTMMSLSIVSSLGIDDAGPVAHEVGDPPASSS